MIELARDSVQPWDCDRNDHLNMQYYVARASDALAALGARVGLGPHALGRRGLMLTETEMHVRFLRELRNGVPYAVQGGFVEAGRDGATAYFELTNVALEQPSATFRSKVILAGVDRLDPEPFEDEIVGRMKAIPASVPAYGQPRGIVLQAPRKTPGLEEADTMGMVRTHQGVVPPSDCDVSGRLLSRAYMAYVFGALSHIFLQTRDENFFKEQGDRKQSGAAVEYRLVFRDRPRAGSLVAMRSGMQAVGEKTFTHTHWLFDAESGGCAATIEAVSIGFDLETRKAIAMTPEMRARFERVLVEGLSV